MRPYYVQVIADNYLKNLIQPGIDQSVHEAHRRGLSPSDFATGLSGLYDFLRAVYQEAADAPESLGMTLRPNDPPDSTDVGYAQSVASFLRVPFLMYALGVCGSYEADMSLTVPGEKLQNPVKLLKLHKLPTLLDAFAKQGLEVSGVGKLLRPSDVLRVRCPGNPAMIVALKAMADAQLAINKGDIRKSKDAFITLDSRILDSAKPKAPKHGIDTLCRALGGEMDEVIRSLDSAASAFAKPAVRTSGLGRNDWACVYTLNAPKQVIMTLRTHQDRLSVKLNLAHIGGYVNTLDSHPAMIRDAVTSAWGCGRCRSSCEGGFRFSYGGKDYDVCRAGAFVFPEVDETMLPHLLSLLMKELEAAA